MMKSGAPPDKFGVLDRLLPIESEAELISTDCHSLVHGLISISLETVWVILRYVAAIYKTMKGRVIHRLKGNRDLTPRSKG